MSLWWKTAEGTQRWYKEFEQAFQTNKLFTKKKRRRGTEICAVSISTASHTNTNLLWLENNILRWTLFKKDYQDAALFSLLCVLWIHVVLFNTTYSHTEYVLSAQDIQHVWKYCKQKQKLRLNQYLRDTHCNCIEGLVLRCNKFSRKHKKCTTIINRLWRSNGFDVMMSTCLTKKFKISMLTRWPRPKLFCQRCNTKAMQAYQLTTALNNSS